MIRHIVLFRIKPEFRAEIPALVEQLYTMKGRVEGLLDLEAGADILGSERSCDIALVCTFADRAAFDAYQTHPLHVPIRRRMREVRESSFACDFNV